MPTRVRHVYVDDEAGGYKKTRLSKKSGVEIPKPPPPQRDRKAGQFDTRPEDALAVTFKPDLTSLPIPKDCML